MKTFKMTAVCNPKNNDTWFPGYSDGREFEAENLEAAQDFINELCHEAGTSDDPQYDENGPVAEESDDEDQFYVTDSRSLLTAGPMTKNDAVEWLNARCEHHGKNVGDWQHPEHWSGTEEPPTLYSAEEWAEIFSGDDDE